VLQHDTQTQTIHSKNEALFVSLTKDEVLTKGFACPSSLTNPEDSVMDTLLSCRADLAPGDTRRVIVVCLELKKNRMVYVILLSVIIGVVGAIVVGVINHDLALGATVGGSIAGFLALLHLIAAWKCS
jgi:hypothetical protein